MRWWWCPLFSRPTRLIYFYSVSQRKQQSADIHVAPLWHIILIPKQPVFALSPYFCVLCIISNKYQLIIFGLKYEFVYIHVLKKSLFMCLLPKDCESAKSWPCVAQCILYCYVIYCHLCRQQGRIQGGRAFGAHPPPPLKFEKIRFFGIK